jgi:hypothetical protein
MIVEKLICYSAIEATLRTTGIDPEISQTRRYEERKLTGESSSGHKIEEFIAEVHGLLIFDQI